MKSIRCLIVSWVMALAFTWCAHAQSERILHFDSHIVVHTNASITVTETIQVVASGHQIKHGIYRDFPQLYQGKWGLRMKTGFEVKAVQRDGKTEPYHLANRANGVRVYIGSQSEYVPHGTHVYKLTYETDHQVGFFKSHDELYWNVTGNGWAFPMDKVTATVVLPPGAEPKSLEAYTGKKGEKGQDFTSRKANHDAFFETTRRLERHEGLTIVVTWPRGFVADTSSASGWSKLLADNKGVALAILGLLLVFVYYLIVWTAVGRDPKPGTIIPLYGPPKYFSPAAVRYLMRMGFDNHAFAAAVLNLAVKGKISIKEGVHKSYTLVRTNSDSSNLSTEEKNLLQNLPSDGKLELKPTEHTAVKEAKDALKTALARIMDKVYFVRNTRYLLPGLLFSIVPLGISLMDVRDIAAAGFMLVWLSFWSFAVIGLLSRVVSLWRSHSWIALIPMSLYALPFVAGEIFGLGFLVYSASFWVAGLFAIGICLNGIFYHLLKAPTLGGRHVMDKIEGFKMYLSVAEKDRLNLENPPERTPKLFEMFLPYALALGVEQKWSEQFADVLTAAGQDNSGYRPGWYSGTSWSSLGAMGFASSFGGSLSGAISSASTAPGSGSGAGGGGSSGGGGGGGGGGGW